MECDAKDQSELNITKLELESVPVEIMQVPKIKVLLAFNNRISVVPSMSAFTNLERLDLSRNALVTISEYRLSGLHSLKTLDLSRNQLEALPEDISRLPVLETLLIHRNKLTKFPDSIGELRTLVLIDASYNNLTVIGDKLDGLLLLTSLNLTFNENLEEQSMSEKCRRLHSMRNILTSKKERRALIRRCLGVDHEVRMKIHDECVVRPMLAEEEKMLNELEQSEMEED